MLLFYVRHGDPIYDPDSLTPLGRRQAEALSKRLAVYGLDAVYASTSRRAIDTARPTCELLKKDLTTMDWCNENHCWNTLTHVTEDGRRGWLFEIPEIIEQLNSPEVRALDRRWYEHPCFRDCAYGPAIQRVQREADAWLASLGYEHDFDKNMYFCREENKRRIALFAHQGFGLAFLSCVLDVPYNIFSTHFNMTHSGMSVIQFPEEAGWGTPKLLQLSGDGHLYREGLPTRYNNGLRF
jgi:probable phosphoglycerate mutase